MLYRKRSLSAPDNVMYVLNRRRIFGFEICSGWLVTLHPLGGGPPQGSYTVGSCAGEAFAPASRSDLPLPPGMRSPSHAASPVR